MSTGAGKVVCVTGASGYMASWLVKLLLDRGYIVKATVRSLREPRKVEHLMALEGAQERLLLFEANLTEEGSFDSAVDGCEGVFHTATPVFLSVADPQAELIEPAVKGTLNILRSCKKVPLIKRVVVTSSIATIIYNRNPLNPDVVVDETWFSDPVYCEETKQWYAISKTLAEEAARKFADENDIDLVTLHPGFIIGPLLQPTLNLTSEAVVNLIKEGREDWPNRYVDVRDVAYAHILAFENPSVRGRYCLVESVTHSSEVPKILNRLYPSLYPSLSLSGNTTDNEAATPPYQISKERAKSLGLNFTPLEVSLMDTVENLKEKNFLNF